MKQLRLDNRREVTITDEAYAQIIALVNANKICGKCRRPYDTVLPQVAENLCLGCFQKKYEGMRLTYVGLERRNDQGDETHLFLDTRGSVYYTATSSGHEPQMSTFATLLYWGFPVPTYVMRAEKQIELSTWEWYIYGDVKTNSVLYIHHRPRLDSSVDVAFLTYRHGETQEVNKRRKYFQRLFKEARARLEATRDAQGYYHVNGHEVAGIYDAYLFEGVAEIASGEYDAQLKGAATTSEPLEQ